MSHRGEVVEESVKRHPVTNGLTFTVRCCDHEHSVHIQAPGKYTPEELERIVEDHCRQAEEEHSHHVAAEEFVRARARGPAPVAPAQSGEKGEEYKGCCP